MYTLIDGVQFYDKDEVDDLFTQNGSTGLSGRLDQEAIDRAAADAALGTRIDQESIDRAALGTRIDQESNVRLLGDQTLANQLTALEQLWSTLIAANFIDTDNNNIVSDDSGKSVRQIAHDEFYRQLVTDADDVKHQLDTLKELADYLQNNPTILTDIYTKLGLTWSLDTPTDFGTFDFSSVLAATDIDSAIVELHNALTNKVGDLTQLTTTFKGTIVGAVNELDAEIGNLATLNTVEKGTIVGAINSEFEWRRKNDAAIEQRLTALGTRIDTEIGTLSALTTTAKDSIVSAVNELDTDIGNEVTARTDADTALGTRIDTEIGTLSALTTTAKDNVVAAINEVNDKVGTGGGGGGGGADTTQLEAKLNAEIAARTQGDTDLDNKITASVGTLSSLTTTAKTNLVAAVNEVKALAEAGGGGGGGGGGNTYRYTFVVDSSAALTAWANNDRSGGKDYTSVLIRKGTWTSSKGVNLTAAGTKVVVGEAGSKLVFNDVDSGLYYNIAPTEPEYYMRGVTVESTGTGGNSLGFRLCTNLTNCSGTVTVTGNAGTGYGFDSCTNLTNCSGTGFGTGTSSGTGSGTNHVSGFRSCTNLTNCSGTGIGDGFVSGFRECTSLTNCSGTSSGTNHVSGFRSCTNLTNCSGTGTGDGFVSGFRECTSLTNCSGTGTGPGSGYGFNSCNVVIGCNAGEHCTTAVFEDCYASSSKTSTYACADTPNGGFNNPTNPS